MAQEGGHKARARAHFQHGFVALHLQLLQHAGFHARCQHHLAFTQRHFGVHKGQGLHGGRHEVLAAHGGQQAQHGAIQHIPGADLLLNHVEAGLFDVHGESSGLSADGFRKTRDFRRLRPHLC